jgi:GntR family transcriptional repressor for pyruvate dehydrogenase complex
VWSRYLCSVSVKPPQNGGVLGGEREPANSEADAAVKAVFQPVRTATTFEETVERLGTAIRMGLLPAGSRLPAERTLADRLRISRSTLREAITTLVQTGHLVSHRGRTGGNFVADRPPLAEEGETPLGAEARAVLDHRVAIELGATVLAAERAEGGELDRLDDLVEKMASASEFEDYRRADMRFHVGVAEAARSPRLLAEMTEVQGQVSDLIAMIPHPDQVLTHSNTQHGRLVRLLRKRDRRRAVMLMREHIEGTEHILAGLI